MSEYKKDYQPIAPQHEIAKIPALVVKIVWGSYWLMFSFSVYVFAIVDIPFHWGILSAFLLALVAHFGIWLTERIFSRK